MNFMAKNEDLTERAGMVTLSGGDEGMQVNYLHDVVYSYADGQPLHLQILTPVTAFRKGEGKRYPLLLFVQGSGWAKQDCYFALPSLYPLVRQGFIAASVEHRGSDKAVFPAQLKDIKTAVRFFRAKAEEYCVDPERIGIMGNSSGGHLSLMVGVTGDRQEFRTEEYAEYSDKVRLVMDFYGPTDVSRVNEGRLNQLPPMDRPKPEDLLFGGKVSEHPELSEPGNPLRYVSPGSGNRL